MQRTPAEQPDLQDRRQVRGVPGEERPGDRQALQAQAGGRKMTESQAAYRRYLDSEKWKTIRAQRLAMDNGECVLCGDPARHVHHRRYPKKWGTETVNDLICLCDKCHTKHHDKEKKEIYGSPCGLCAFVDLFFAGGEWEGRNPRNMDDIPPPTPRISIKDRTELSERVKADLSQFFKCCSECGKQNG